MSGRLTDQQKRDRAMSEADLVGQLTEVAAMLDWTWMVVGPLRTSHGWRTATRGPLGAGWPDLLLIHRRTGRMLFCEVKKELGKTTPDQDRVLGVLRAAGLEAHVIRPSDFDRFVEVLRS